MQDIWTREASKNIIFSFLKAYRFCLDFKGRTCRYDFWGFMAVSAILYFVIGLLASRGTSDTIIRAIYSIAFIPVFASIVVRRLHDINYNEKWFFILPLVICAIITIFTTVKVLQFYIYFMLLFLLCCKKGRVEANKYGEPIIEDASHIRRTWGLIFILVIIPMSLIAVVLWTGSISGFSKAMNRHSNQKTILQVKSIANNVHLVYATHSTYDGLDNQTAFNSGIVPEQMRAADGYEIKMANGKKMHISGAQRLFEMTISDISRRQCQLLSKSDFSDSPNFIKVKVNDGDANCNVCATSPCTLTWVYE